VGQGQAQSPVWVGDEAGLPGVVDQIRGGSRRSVGERARQPTGVGNERRREARRRQARQRSGGKFVDVGSFDPSLFYSGLSHMRRDERGTTERRIAARAERHVMGLCCVYCSYVLYM
jgi:hypothetical protein